MFMSISSFQQVVCLLSILYCPSFVILYVFSNEEFVEIDNNNLCPAYLLGPQWALWCVCEIKEQTLLLSPQLTFEALRYEYPQWALWCVCEIKEEILLLSPQLTF